MSHWFHSEQRNHWFGYWFGHDMFTPPFVGPDNQLTYDAKLRDAAAKGTNGVMVYPEMARDAILFGGTDPGRFCPTYTIFCESFIPHRCQPEQDQNYDRRDVYIITQNALADNTYLDYIRAQYNRSAQIDPPFFQNFLKDSLPSIFHQPTRWLSPLDDLFEGIGAKVERRRRTSTSWFTPGQILKPQALAADLRKSDHQTPLSSFLYGKFSPDTQHLIDTSSDESALRRALSKEFNAILDDGNIYDAKRFQNIKLPSLIEKAVSSPTLVTTTTAGKNNIIRLDRRMLEEAYPDDITKSLGGVYPDTEILTPTQEDSQQCFNDYLQDAQRRLQHDTEFPNEPRQIKPNEDVHVEGGRVSVSGQVAVMSINGLLTKVIFDKNPDHEFYVEESFPLDWMYPYLTPFGVIMKINRNPVPELTQEIVDKDHAFWSQFSRRTIGNWITYDTSVKQVCDFAEKVYLRHDFNGFTGDRKFVRDDDGQKAFSKLRSSIAASIYQWRSKTSRNPAERARVTKEAEFAFKQAFAYCPYSPEAVFHFMELLLNQNRLDDALAILRTCQKLDPYNGQINDWVDQLSRSKTTSPADQVRAAFGQIQHAIDAGQTNTALQGLDQIVAFVGSEPSALLGAADMYLRLGSPKGVQILDRLLKSPTSDANTLIALANEYLRVGQFDKSEEAVKKLVAAEPNSSEPLYNLAVIQSHRGETAQAIDSLKKSLALNAVEMAKNPKMIDLRKHVFEDQNFVELRKNPDFIKAIGAQP
jgi:tetratricopeptide (TPR) repeat protein